MSELSPTDPAMLEAYLEFLIAAGVDCPLDDEPVDRYAQSAQQLSQRAASTREPHPSTPGNQQPSGRIYAPVQQAREAAANQDMRAAAKAILDRTKRSSDAPASGPNAQVSAVIPDHKVVSSAREAAASAKTLDELKDILARFDGCNLKQTAKNLVFSDGNPHARIMMIGEAPGRDEDLQGVPFVGRSGQLLDRIMAAAGLDRSQVYVGNVVPWRPPGNRTPTPQETEICRPFIQRQIELVNPSIVVFLGAASAQSLAGARDGIRKLRGRWMTYDQGGIERQAIATFHPAYLLRNPIEKRFVWRDMLAIKSAFTQL
ncbi:uracil-DNA glycosylase [Pseudovibrio exalbescens]|uniref:uracil-DNA glycosylase n=1 Tax=Pseudovibrio exalbescens TaxID=197461 RepID=UPI0023665F6D|nr:uracil-DNA glycosylase [Pseudovibrio exalbescens]MDD7911230.1 uracil-DNA glycosylase [Pseudovibrio exalbescens]